jgi:hypothetical protein
MEGFCGDPRWYDICTPVGMRLSSFLLSLFVLVPLAACADSAEQPATAEGAFAPGPVKITVKASDSKAAAAFLEEFTGQFTQIARNDFKQDSGGASTREEIEHNIFKVRRNDGQIECSGDAKPVCTFELKPVEVRGGVPVLQGDRNTLAGQIHNDFARARSNPVILAATGGSGGAKPEIVVIGDQKAGIFIECTDGPFENGFPQGICAFNLEKKK